MSGRQNGTYTSLLIHHATINGLHAGTTYYYRIGSDAGGWATEANVRSHPGIGPDVAVNIMVRAGPPLRRTPHAVDLLR